ELGLDHFYPQVIDPATSERRSMFAEQFFQLRQRKGVTLARAKEEILNPNVFGPMLVRAGEADAFLSGLTYDYPDVIRPALQIFHTRPGARRASGVYLMIAHNQ